CNFGPLSSTTSRCSITDDAATLLLGTSVLSSLKGGGLRQAEDPVNPLQPSPILSTKPGQLQMAGSTPSGIAPPASTANRSTSTIGRLGPVTAWRSSPT